MNIRKQYRRTPDQHVVAIPLRLDTPGFSYRKWGAEQHCKPGDWLVDNDGDIYTVDADVFAATYRQLSLGAYVKTSPVWAEQAVKSGSIATKEGRTHYFKGDYVVFNNEDGTDGYAMSAEKFESRYEPDD
ncbi:hypothetical protein [Arthrobacter ruber]|uniref:hypothetical protein n=1 Tax=Arthrobacter ruber TaxID=1258893 RepID=UPI000CF3F787|nr:hypothetical protein [Arthrobacter ruber]